jgi:hypothetical protein
VPNLYSLTTFSGLVVCIATIALLYRYYTIAAVLFIMDGAGGTAIFWDRWSQRAGNQVHIDSIFSPVAPTSSEWAMLVTHLPLAILGLAVLGVMAWQRHQEGRSRDEPTTTLAEDHHRAPLRWRGADGREPDGQHHAARSYANPD